MKYVKIRNIDKCIKQTYDIEVKNNHNFFANGFLIHNCSYTGNIGVIVRNLGTEDFIIEQYDRIAQMVITKIPKIGKFKIVSSLTDTVRSSNGFGSSGK